MRRHSTSPNKGSWLGIGLAATLLLLAPPSVAEDAGALDRLKAGLQKIQSETRKASYAQRTWEKKGSKESSLKADCFWMGQSTIRMNILEGNGKGGVAILKGGKVTAFLSGVLSFAKLTYEPMDSAVVGIRGLGMPTSGFMDDLKIVLNSWDNKNVTLNGDNAEIAYTGPDKLPTKMWVKSDGTMVIKTETYENGQVVVKNEYSRVNFSATFDSKQIFDP